MVKINFDIPKEMIEAAQTAEIKSNPHNLCFFCPAHTVTCAGTNEMALTSEQFVDRANKLAKIMRKTRANIAEDANRPEPTVVSVLTKRTLDPRHSTMQAISKSVNGGCWGAAPCYMAALLLNGQITPESVDVEEIDYIERINDLETQLKEARVQLERVDRLLDGIHASYKMEMDAIRERSAEIEKYLRGELVKRDKVIETKDKIITKMVLGK